MPLPAGSATPRPPAPPGAPATSSTLLFYLNGKRVELTDADPSMTLVEYIRVHAGLIHRDNARPSVPIAPTC